MSEDPREASVPWCDECRCYHRSETHGACDRADHLRRLILLRAARVLRAGSRGTWWLSSKLADMAADLYVLADILRNAWRKS